MEQDSDPAPPPAPRRAAPVRRPGPAAPRRIPSGELLGDRSEVEILHGEEIYRLRRTRGGKLILTK